MNRQEALHGASVIEKMTLRIGWIGLGGMGRPMAERVLAAGWPLALWARSRAQAEPLIDQGATWAGDLAELAQGRTHVVTILRGSNDVQQVYEALSGHLTPGTHVIDMTTAAPGIAMPLAERLRQRGASWLDCPVTGGVAGARQGALTLFAGGDAAALQGCRPVLMQLGQRIVACGGPGSGYRMKLINQTLMAGALLGLAEGAAMARASGITGRALLEALDGGTGSGWMFKAYAERMVDGGGAVGFTLAMLHKDLQLALEAAQELGEAGTRVLGHALAVVAAACQRHGPQAGVQALALD